MLLSFRNRIQSVVDEFAYQSLQYDNRSTSMTNYSNLSNVSRHSTPETSDQINLAQCNESTSNQEATEECNESTQSVQNDESLTEFYSRYQLL